MKLRLHRPRGRHHVRRRQRIRVPSSRRHGQDRRGAREEPADQRGRDDAGEAVRAEGETLHKAGKHTESVEVLGKAMKILKI